MSLFGRLFNNPEHKRNQVALDIDLQTGVLERCDVCNTVTDKQRDDRLPAADAEAHQAFDRNDPKVAIFEGNREDLLKRLRRVREPCPYLCDCENN